MVTQLIDSIGCSQAKFCFFFATYCPAIMAVVNVAPHGSLGYFAVKSAIFVFIVSTLLYAFVLPPFEVHDEPAHFAKAAQLAYLAFPQHRQGEEVGASLPAALVQLTREWAPTDVGEPVTVRPISTVTRDLELRDKASSGLEFGSFAYIASYPPIFYLPQAAGLALAGRLGLSPLGQFYAGRLAGGVLALALVMAAIRILPTGRRAMLAIAILPGCASQFASYSADSEIFAVAFLTSAVLLRRQQACVDSARWPAFVLLPLLTLAKGVYLPIAAIGLGQAGAFRWRPMIAIVVPVSVGLAVFLAWYDVVANGEIGVQHYVSHLTLQHVVSATPGPQFAFIAAHPVIAGWAIVTTIVQRLPIYAMDCIGRFGAFIVMLPAPLYVLGALVAIGGLVETNPEAEMPTSRQRVVWLAIVACVVVLIHLALYVTATALGEPYVEGVQGRYLIPALPLLSLALRMRVAGRAGAIVVGAWPFAAALLMAGGLATAAMAFWHG
jgi:uncharacterized membrane protein